MGIWDLSAILRRLSVLDLLVGGISWGFIFLCGWVRMIQFLRDLDKVGQDIPPQSQAPQVFPRFFQAGLGHFRGLRGEVCTERPDPGARKSWDLGYRDSRTASVELWEPNPNWEIGFGTIRASLIPQGILPFPLVPIGWMQRNYNSQSSITGILRFAQEAELEKG